MNFLSAWLGLVFLLSELLLVWRRKSAKVVGAKEQDQGSLKLLWRVIGLSITAGVLLATFNVGPRLPWHLPWGALSLATFALGVAVRWWAIVHLGRFFTVDVAIASDHRLVDTGPYRWVRHPSYTGLLLQCAGVILAFGNPLALLAVVVPIFLALNHRMQVEEAALTSQLGPEYKKYTNRTKRLVPLVY